MIQANRFSAWMGRNGGIVKGGTRRVRPHAPLKDRAGYREKKSEEFFVPKSGNAAPE